MQISNKKFNIILTSCLIAIVIIRYYFVIDNNRNELIEKYARKVSVVYGTIHNNPLTKDFTKTFTLKAMEINEEPTDISIKVETDRYRELEYGQKLKLTGKLSEPFNFKGDGGRTFDYIDFLLKDGIYFIMKKPKIEIMEMENGDNSSDFSVNISKSLFQIKQGFLANINKVLGEPHSALAGGLVVGEKSALGKELIDDFRKTGLIHIVVLSGYNITIVADSIRRMLASLPRAFSIILGGFSIIAFGILVGGGATVVRSCIMALIAIFGTYFRKDYNAGKALFIAGIIMYSSPHLLNTF